MTIEFKFYGEYDPLQKIIEAMPPGKNTSFLSNANHMFRRWGTGIFDKNPPVGLVVDGDLKSLIFATISPRTPYANLYEIGTKQGEEGKGYSSKIWDFWIKYAVEERKVQRLKMSCTTTSLTWHLRNGVIGWAIDPTGAIRTDQPLFPTREGQLRFRELAVNAPEISIPPEKELLKLYKEDLSSYNFTTRKRLKSEEAIKSMGKYWFREHLISYVEREKFNC